MLDSVGEKFDTAHEANERPEGTALRGAFLLGDPQAMSLSQFLIQDWRKCRRHQSILHDMTFTSAGLVWGAGTLLAAMTRDSWLRPCLALEGREERILTLLSMAHNKPLPPDALRPLFDASRHWCKGEPVRAYFHLAYGGLSCLPEEEADAAAMRLFAADQMLARGADAAKLLADMHLLPCPPQDWPAWARAGNPYEVEEKNEA